MRIISPFRDYYDSLQTHEGELYLREPQVVDKNYNWRLFGETFYSYFRRDEQSPKQFIVGFCGKLYHGLILFEPYSRKERFKAIYEDCFKQNFQDSKLAKGAKICWNIEDVDATFENSDFKDFYYNGLPKNNRYHNRSNFPKEHTRTNFEKYFTVEETSLNMDWGVPIFVVETPIDHYDNKKAQITLNACLKNLEFFRIFPTNEAFQEVEMFLYKIAKPEKPIPVPDDVTLAEIKGFDKYSFRKDKQKK